MLMTSSGAEPRCCSSSRNLSNLRNLSQMMRRLWGRKWDAPPHSDAVASDTSALPFFIIIIFLNFLAVSIFGNSLYKLSSGTCSWKKQSLPFPNHSTGRVILIFILLCQLSRSNKLIFPSARQSCILL